MCCVCVHTPWCLAVQWPTIWYLGLRCAVGFLDGSPPLKQLFLLGVPLCFATRRWPNDTQNVGFISVCAYFPSKHACSKNILRSLCPLCSIIYVQLYADMSDFTLIGCAPGDVQLYMGMSNLTRLPSMFIARALSGWAHGDSACFRRGRFQTLSSKM